MRKVFVACKIHSGVYNGHNHDGRWMLSQVRFVKVCLRFSVIINAYLDGEGTKHVAQNEY